MAKLEDGKGKRHGDWPEISIEKVLYNLHARLQVEREDGWRLEPSKYVTTSNNGLVVGLSE